MIRVSCGQLPALIRLAVLFLILSHCMYINSKNRDLMMMMNDGGELGLEAAPCATRWSQVRFPSWDG